jgi:diketogulonate reductase-like aldo/keto reductase
MAARPRVFLATKVWTTGRERGLEQMQRSAQLLRTQVIDLMQIHNLVDWRTQLATLRSMKAGGRIRYIGITHYTVSALSELARVLATEPGIDFVQLGYSLATREPETALLLAAAAHGIAVIINQPFEQGSLFRRIHRQALPRLDARILLRELGTVVPQIYTCRARVHLRDPGDKQFRAHEGGSRRLVRQAPQPATAPKNPRALGRQLTSGRL